jgi:hypothetical protein
MAHELDEQCGNCTHFFPDRNGPTEYGICILNPVFASYVDDIFELRFDRCRELIKAKRFSLDHDICEKFEPVELLETDTWDGSTEPVELTTIFDEDQQARMHLAYDQNGDIWVNGIKTPLQRYIDQLNTPRSQQSGLNNLCAFSIMGNEHATTALIDFFERLGPPRTLEEVHFKVAFLERMTASTSPSFLELLLADLEATPSNNTTRQWLNAIIKSLHRFPKEAVEDRLRDMIQRNVFSHRLRGRIEDMLDEIQT